MCNSNIDSKFLPKVEQTTANQRKKFQEINSTAPAPTILYSKLVLPPPKNKHMRQNLPKAFSAYTQCILVELPSPNLHILTTRPPKKIQIYNDHHSH
jgi:hypothetical protein